MAEYTPRYMPGAAQTWVASATITAGQLLVVSGSGTVAPSSAASPAFIGVAGNDAASGANVTVYAGGVQKIVATGTVTAAQSVEAATAGTVATHTLGTNDGNIVGVAVTTATAGNVAYIQMER
jgi:hypothetical protein